MGRTLILTVLALALLGAAPAADAATWRWPVRGKVVGRFSMGPHPYAARQHRGVDIAAAPGTPVVSACAGTVGFAGRVPGGGVVVSVRCGRLTATYLHLRSAAVRRGQALARGAPVGKVGRSADARQPSPHLHLGARVTGRRLRYVDPLGLIGEDPPRAPVVRTPTRLPPLTAPTVRAPARLPPLGIGPAPLVPRLAPEPTGVFPATRDGLPLVVWLGLALLGAAVPAGALRVGRRRANWARREARVASPASQ